jgi:hypothetical protein
MKKSKKTNASKILKGGLAVIAGYAAAGIAKYGVSQMMPGENLALYKIGAAGVVSGGLGYASAKKKIPSDYGMLASGGALLSTLIAALDLPQAKPINDAVGKFLHGEDSLIIDVTPQNAERVARAIMPARQMNGGNNNPMGGNQIAFAGNQIAFAGGNSNPMGGRGGRMGI